MIVKLTNLQNNLSVQFYDYFDFIKSFGSQNTTMLCYSKFALDNNIFLLNNHAGFLGNPEVTPYSVAGVNEDGVNFKANHFNSRIITLEFMNVFSGINKFGLSPNNMVNTVLLAKNNEIEVEVRTSENYKNTFFVTPETETESGLIVLESSRGQEGIYWEIEPKFKQIEYVFGQDNPYITKNLPQVLLNEKVYPWEFDVISFVETSPVYKIGGSSSNWDKVQLTNTLGSKSVIYENLDNDNYVIIDVENQTITNASGVDRRANASGDLFFNLQAGINLHKILINDNIDYETDTQYLPLDFRCEIDFTRYAIGIQ